MNAGDLLERAVQAVLERKRAVLGVPEDPRELVGGMLEREGVSAEVLTRCLLSGLDLEPEELNDVALRYVDSYMECMERALRGGDLPELPSILGSSWFDGFLMGAGYQRELDRASE